MPVEPSDAARFGLPDRAEIQPSGEWPVKHYAGDDRYDEQQPHASEKQLAGFAREHVGMEFQDYQHRARADRTQRFGRVGAEGLNDGVVGFSVRRAIGVSDDYAGIILVPSD